jgi:putative SOS response-associated peptidase YedK
MCGRYRLSRRKQIVEEYFAASDDEEWTPRYDIAPTQPVPIIRQNPKEPVRDPGMRDVAAAAALLKPYNARPMGCYPVSTRVNLS